MKSQKPIRRVSKARAKQRREYDKVKPEFLASHSHCFACGSFVELARRIIHHFYKRKGMLLAWLPGFRMACVECHYDIHFDETRARTWGFLAPKECCDDFKRAQQHYESTK